MKGNPMKKFTLLICVAAIILINPGLLRAADLKDGFKGIPAGTEISELPDFVQVIELMGF